MGARGRPLDLAGSREAGITKQIRRNHTAEQRDDQAHDLATAQRFLTALDEEAEAFTFQTFDDDSERKDQRLARILHGTLDEHAGTLIDLNNRGAGIFVMVQCGNGEGRKNENVTGIRTAYQEDDGDGKELPLEPHITVQSSPGKYHRYMLVDGLSLEEFDGVQRRLVDSYGSDPNAKDRARVLRLPGFFNNKPKYDRPRVNLIAVEPMPPYSREEILKALPPATSKPSPSPTVSSKSGQVVDGGRNDFLSREAYRARKQGSTVEQIYKILKAINDARCSPPLADGEVQAIAEGKKRIEPAPEVPVDLRQRLYNLESLLSDAVYLKVDDTITLLSDPTVSFKPGSFMRTLAASRVQTDGGALPVAKLWLNNEGRKTLYTRTFAPGQPAICPDPDGFLAVNLWRDVIHKPPSDWRRKVKPFVAHIKYLIPDEDDRQQFMLWLSHMIQHPGERPPWHILMYTDGTTGIGRNCLAEIVGRVVQPYAALNTDISELAGTQHGRGFNGSLERKFFICIDEIHASAFSMGGRRVMETLKMVLTAETRLLNPKYGKQSKEFDRSRVLILSNHIDAIPLDDNDRRFLVIENPNVQKSHEYYAELYSLRHDPEFIASVWMFLKSFDLAGFIIGRPPISKAKQAVIEATEPGHVTRLRDLFENPPTTDHERATRTAPGEIPELVLYGQTKKQTGLDSQRELEGYQLQDALRVLGGKKYGKRLRFGGSIETVWVMRNHGKWMGAHTETIKNYFLKVATGPYRVVPPWVPHPDYPGR